MEELPRVPIAQAHPGPDFQKSSSPCFKSEEPYQFYKF